MSKVADLQRLGIVAGGGEIPFILVEECKKRNKDFFVIFLEGHAQKKHARSEIDYPNITIKLGEVGKGVKYLKQNNVKDIVMIGNVKRPSFVEIRPDWWTTKFLAKIARKAFGDDKLLKSIIYNLEKEGFNFVAVNDIVSSLLAPSGVLGRHKPDKKTRIDIKRGIDVALTLGKLDVGQSVIVQEGIVLAVEAIEGTDELIKRSQTLKRQGNKGVLVKMKKPNQDKRADLPTVGIKTLENVKKAGLGGVAIMAGATLIVGIDEFIKKADELGLFVISLTKDEIGSFEL